MRSDALAKVWQDAGARFDQAGSTTGAILDFGDPAAEALACFEAGCVRDRSRAALLAVTGNDRTDFVQRMCTNDVRRVDADSAVWAAFTTDKGRVVDHMLVFDRGDDQLALFGSDDMTFTLVPYLKKYIVMEDCEILDLGDDQGVLEIWGAAAHESLSQATSATLLPRENGFAAASGSYDGAPVLLAGTRSPSGLGAIVSGPADPIAKLAQQLIATGLREIGDAAYDQARIEAGIPLLGKELGDHCNPLEAGLRNSVSFTKGCYIGQEVVARLNSYAKVRRHLSGMKFPAGTDPAGLGEVFQNLLRIGNITSAAHSPRLDATVALALLKAGYEKPGGQVEVVIDGENIQGEICELPFAMS